MASKKILATRIKEVRTSAKITQEQLAKKAKVSYSTLAKLERGAISNPSVFTVVQICKVLGISVEELLKGKSPSYLEQGTHQSIDFVYCDINGVLVRFFQKAFVRMAEVYGISSVLIESTFWHYNDAANRGEMSLSEFNKALSAKVGVEGLDWQKYYLEEVETIPAMHDCLRSIATKTKVGLLSNIHSGFIPKMIKSGLVPDIDYDVIIDSSVVGAIKPEAKIFEIAQEQAGVAAENIFFIDDSRTNLMAAERQGWRVLWFDDYRPEDSVKRVQTALRSSKTTHPIERHPRSQHSHG